MHRDDDPHAWNGVTLILGIYGIIVASLILRRFASAALVAGWDLIPHYYLLHSMVDNLSSGDIFRYDPHWFAGYPSFTFYAPLTYIITALPTVMTSGAIPASLTFNLSIFLAPYAFLAALFYSTKVFFGRLTATLSIFFGLAFLLSTSDHLQAPFGIYGSLVHGNVNAFAGTILILLLFGLLQRNAEEFSPKLIAAAIIATIALILTHTISAIFAAVLFLFFLGNFSDNSRIRIACIGLFSVAATSFWWWPLLKFIDFTSGVEIGQTWTDPLAALIPDISLIRKCTETPSLGMLLRLPIISFAMAACGLLGFLTLIRTRNFFLPITFITILLILPRNILPQVTSAPIHYYRFVMPLFALYLIIASHGARVLVDAARRPHNSIRRNLASGLGLVVLFWSLFNLAIKDYGPAINRLPIYKRIYDSSSLACGAQPHPSFPIPLHETPRFADAINVVNFIGQQLTEGRVASETAGTDNLAIGSPHFFSTLLPMLYDIEAIPGLLAESSYSSQFLTSTIGYMSFGVRWGMNHISRYFVEGNSDVSIDSMIYRLRMWSVDFYIASSDRYKALLERADSRQIRVVFSSGRFTVYQLIKPFPKLRALEYQPYLFVDLGGSSFRSIAEQWFVSDAMIRSPIIYTEKKFSQLAAFEQEAIGGFILSVPGGVVQPKNLIEPWLKLGKPVVVIGDAGVRHNLRARWIANGDDFQPLSDQSLLFEAIPAERLLYRELPNFIPRAKITSLEAQSISSKLKTNNTITFSHDGGVVINYSYFPRWKSKNPDQTVFQAAPSVMYVVSRGRTELVYD